MGGDVDGGADVASLLREAETSRRMGRLAAARDGFMRSAEAAEAAEDTEAFVTAALGLGGIWVHEQRDVVARAAVHSIWQRAGYRARAGSLERSRLAVREAAEATYEGGPVEDVMTSVEEVRSFGDPAATAEALSLLHHVQLGPRYAETRLPLADEIVTLAASAHDTLLSLMGLCWRTVDLFLLGDPRAGQSLVELTERAQAEECEALGFVADVLAAMVLARAGRFERAEAVATEACDRGARAGDPDALAYFGAMLAPLRWWQGRASEIVETVRTISTSPRLGTNDHVYVAADALLSAALGDTDSSEEALARLHGIGLDRIPHSSSWLTTQFLVAETAFLIGDSQLAAAVRDLLAPYAHLPVMPSLAVVCLGSCERALGLCAAVVGQGDAAVHHLESAIRADQRLGNRPMTALTEHSLAGILRARGRQGDGVWADELSTRAQARAGRVGLVLAPEPAWLAPGELAARTAHRPRDALLQPRAGGWRVVVDGRSTLLPNLVGFGYLAHLISHPRRHVEVLDLASGGLIRLSAGDVVADASALASYRRRVRELTDLIERPTLPPSTAEAYRAELATLTETLRSAVGLGGRSRSFPHNGERARTAVRKAIVRAVSMIGAAEPELGHHLDSSVETGTTCCYSPAPGWSVQTQVASD